jgi:hypothetical protein
MKSSEERDCGVTPRSHLTMVQMDVTSMPVASQKGHAPPPGPDLGTQPTFSSVLFHMIPADMMARTIATRISAVRTVIPAPP